MTYRQTRRLRAGIPAIIISLAAAAHAAPAVLDISGAWEFRIDPANEGVAASWFSPPAPWTETVRLPGAMQEQGKGFIPGPETRWWNTWKDRPARLKAELPHLERHLRADRFWTTAFLVPDRHYIGAAWYARDIEIPAGWRGRRIMLHLERCHWETRVWIDGRAVGHRNSLATPHEYDLTTVLPPGRHRIAVRVDNGEKVDLGGKAHSVSDETAGTWNGIVGRLELRASAPVWIDDVQVHPNAAARTIRVRGSLGRLPGRDWPGSVRLEVIAPGGRRVAARDAEVRDSDAGSGLFGGELKLGADAPLWDEFNPALHRLEVSFGDGTGDSGGSGGDRRTVAFGLRDFRAAATQFSINGRPVFLRGNVDCAVFAKTGYAPMDIESWRGMWRIYREWGFNHARFHSWCPPEAAFAAADEAGIYLAPEVGEWTSVRTPEQEAFLRRESAAMLRRYGNHPSFVMMGLGNEAGGDRDILSRLLAEWKKDGRRAYTIKANSRANPPGIDYEVVREVGGTAKKPGERARYQSGWPPKPTNTLMQARPPQTGIDWRAAVAKAPYPIIAHETGQFCSYPDAVREPAHFTGYLRPTHLDIAREQLEARGMLAQAADFARASGLWQVELYKEEIEASLRTPGLAGFQLLQLNDFSGQDSAPVGMFDATWTRKPHADAARFREFCGPTVAIARLPRRTWLAHETATAAIELTHHGAAPLARQPVEAEVRDHSGRTVWRTRVEPRDYPVGAALPVGRIEVPLRSLAAPAAYRLHVSLPGTDVRNRWDFWVYPSSLPSEPARGVLIAHRLDDAARARLAEGGTVLLLPRADELAGSLPMCFTTFYWTTFGMDGGQSSACGLLCDPSHPAFREFPTDPHGNWQWWDLLTRASPMILDEEGRAAPWPKSHRPLVQMIDSWKINRKLAVLAEARVGGGRLAVCSIDLETDLGKRPAARQFRHSLLRYLASADFAPRDTLSVDAVDQLFRPSGAPAGATR